MHAYLTAGDCSVTSQRTTGIRNIREAINRLTPIQFDAQREALTVRAPFTAVCAPPLTRTRFRSPSQPHAHTSAQKAIVLLNEMEADGMLFMGDPSYTITKVEDLHFPEEFIGRTFTTFKTIGAMKVNRINVVTVDSLPESTFVPSTAADIVESFDLDQCGFGFRVAPTGPDRFLTFKVRALHTPARSPRNLGADARASIRRTTAATPPCYRHCIRMCASRRARPPRS